MMLDNKEPYIPKLGEYIRVELYGFVEDMGKSVFHNDTIRVNLRVKLNEKDTMCVIGIPTLACEPFTPEQDYEARIANAD